MYLFHRYAKSHGRISFANIHLKGLHLIGLHLRGGGHVSYRRVSYGGATYSRIPWGRFPCGPAKPFSALSGRNLARQYRLFADVLYGRRKCVYRQEWLLSRTCRQIGNGYSELVVLWPSLESCAHPQGCTHAFTATFITPGYNQPVLWAPFLPVRKALIPLKAAWLDDILAPVRQSSHS